MIPIPNRYLPILYLHSICVPGQCKSHVNPAGWFAAHLTAACGDHYKLPSLRFESCGRSISGERQRRLPEQPATIFVERSKLFVEICCGDEYQTTGSHNRAAVVLAARIPNSFFDELRILAKRDLPDILAGVEINRAQRSPRWGDGRIVVRIEKSFVPGETVATGIVGRESTGPGKIVCIDVQDSTLRVER